MKWQGWSQRAEQWSEELREEAREHVGDIAYWRIAAAGIGAVGILLIALGIYWSREPAPFEVSASVSTILQGSVERPAQGAVTTSTLAQIITTLLDKRGGFINNDISPPGIWLDNMPHWEIGVLQQTRDMTRSLRDDIGRENAEAEPDDDLARAEPRLNFSENSWMLPASESQYRDARDYLRAYSMRLQKHQAQTFFVATPIALDRYLARVTARLDASVQRLSACIEPRENPLRQSNVDVRAITPPVQTTTTGQLDDIFYEARGSAWALSHLLRAIDIDFAAVLREKNAHAALQEAIRALDAAQGPIYSPVILNGSGFGLVANHSLVMASYIARADAAVVTVRRLLTEPIPAQNTSIENIGEAK